MKLTGVQYCTLGVIPHIHYVVYTVHKSAETAHSFLTCVWFE